MYTVAIGISNFKKIIDEDIFYIDKTHFIKAMLIGNPQKMQYYMNIFAKDMFSYFDTGSKTSAFLQPEKFYHGFVLGLMVDIKDRYIVDSNRESGFGRYDICVIPRDVNKDCGIIIEFKVFDNYEDKSFEQTAYNALAQIEEKAYEQRLLNLGVGKIYKYGIAFKGKQGIIKLGGN